MATIKDVAALSGVSISTVSRTLSGAVPVSEEVRARVMDAVEQLHYEPNALARGLKKRGTQLIALVVPNIMNPIFPAVARGVEDTARKLGYNVILCNTDEQREVEIKYINDLHKHWVDGYIFATAAGDGGHILQLQKQGTPAVLLIRDMEKLSCGFDSVLINNEKGAYDMTRFLIERGNRRIALVSGNTEFLLYRQRCAGYRKALAEAGIPLEEDLLLEVKDIEGSTGYQAVQAMLRGGEIPDAIFATSDPIAIGTMHALRDFGLRIPEDISVAGFDNLDISAKIEPPLTTMSQPLYKMGALAAKLLVERIEGKTGKPPKRYVVNPKLVVRRSVRI